MTVPTVANNGYVSAWTDGVYAYFSTGAADTTARKWSVSGTTFTAVDTATCVAGASCNMFDGTTSYGANYDPTTGYPGPRPAIKKICRHKSYSGNKYNKQDFTVFIRCNGW